MPDSNSRAFRGRLATVEQSFAGRYTVVGGLDVQVVVFRKNGEICLRFTSILRPLRRVHPSSIEHGKIMLTLEREVPGHQSAIHHMQLPADPIGIGRGQK